MTTIYDVAKRCQVSTATVSMVLTNKGRISDKTRKRVLDAVSELGYIYNQAAANLRHKRSNSVGLLIPDIVNPFYAELIAGLSGYLEENEVLLFLAHTEENVAKQNRLIESLISQNAGGLILCPAPDTDKQFLSSVKHRGIPIVQVVRQCDDAISDYVGTNNFLGVQMATEHLIRQGHRHIAFVGGSLSSQTRAHRIGGYMAKLLEHGIAPNEHYMVSCKASRADGASATHTLLDAHPEITAIIGYQDIVAFGVMRAIKDRGLRVGKDIAVIGFDDVPEASDSSPNLSTVSVSARKIGEAAGECVLARMRGDSANIKSVIFPPQLCIRRSCG
ncbi:LacI family DNA-binding transcriptional regulator [Enterovibrio sp. ZSDZ35]|uniref:LacI family DNA-binding transcriptional regulator n=1 Tax=Enterovibrio qingdaonensis TaxID=2899818 RepID=A0ABT5QIA9_9GAMM|nr:LacI family DNA-binding transcriptional regulator [Enterovibrio sp. ZSDZ35]MDD1780359.1 LacI family DNA-binding transcriptional regulator [Enterovibrio sp. ZSDZ35]